MCTSVYSFDPGGNKKVNAAPLQNIQAVQKEDNYPKCAKKLYLWTNHFNSYRSNLLSMCLGPIDAKLLQDMQNS